MRWQARRAREASRGGKGHTHSRSQEPAMRQRVHASEQVEQQWLAK